MVKKSLVALGIATAISGCEMDTLFYPSTPVEATRILGEDTLSVFKKWWGEMEECSGKKRDFNYIYWYKVPGITFPCHTGECWGSYYDPGPSIFLADSSVFARGVVGHEILHALRVAHGNPTYAACKVNLDFTTPDENYSPIIKR